MSPAPSEGRQLAELRSGEALIIPDGADSDPIVGRLKFWATNDGINGTQIHFRARGSSASLRDASDVVGLVARQVGAQGNLYAAEFRLGAPGDVLELLYNRISRELIIVLAASSEPSKATASTGISNSELDFTAREAGPAGNDLVVELHRGPGAVEETTAEAVDGAIEVDLAQTGGDEPHNATLTTDIGGNADLEWTLQAADGAAGNADYQVQYILDADADPHTTVFFGSGKLSTVTYGPDTTAQDILDYLDAHDLSSFYTVELAEGSNGTGALDEGTWTFADGTDANPPIDATATTTLGANKDVTVTWTTLNSVTGAGANGRTFSYRVTGANPVTFDGSSGSLVANIASGSTAQDVVDGAALGGYPDIFTIELAEGSNGTGVIGNAPGTAAFAGGIDGGITATAADVKAAIETIDADDRLVDVTFGNGDGSGIVSESTVDNFAGGADADQATTTGDDLKTAIDADELVSQYYACVVIDEGDVGEQAMTSLSGGDDDTLFAALLEIND